MAYGIVKVDNITFDNGGSDQNVTVSGLYRATTSGVTVSGTIAAGTVSGVTVIGSTTVSGATVTGTTANFTSGNFSNLISAAATMSGALIMANQQQVRFREAVGNGVNHIALQAPAIVSADQTITLPDQTGTVVTTGDNGSVTSTMILDGTILNADINASAAIAGTKISPDFGSQTIVTTGVHSAAAGSATTPSIAFTGDLNTGIYSPGADQLALSTAGNGRLFIDGTGFVGIGTVPAVGYVLNIGGLTRVLSGGGPSGLEIGTGTATNQSAYLDLVGDATYTDYGLRVLRDSTGANADSTIRHKGTGVLALITEEAGSITLATSNTERLRIDSSGNVGIGTSSPEAAHLLQANGVIASVSSFGAFTALESAGGTGFRWTLANDGTFRLQRTTDGFSTATTPIFIDSSNRVGIGTSSPSFNLVSANSTTDGGWLYSSGSVSTLGLGGYSLAGDGAFQLKYERSTGVITFNGGSRDTPVERLRIDSSGRLLVGTSSARSNFFNSTITANILLENDNAVLGVVRNGNNAFSSYLVLAKSRSGSNTIVQADDQLGSVNFQGNDGTEFVEAAQIAAFVDGTPGANDMPGRLVFSTAADGAAFTTERMRITNSGIVYAGTTTADGEAHIFERNAPSSYVLRVTNSNTNNAVATNGIKIVYPSVTPDDVNAFLACVDLTNNKATIRNNGGLANYSANNVNLSDINIKKDISPAASTWECLKEWEIVNFRYKDQSDDTDLNLGIIAQQVAESCPEVLTVYQESKEATEDQPAQEERLGVKEQQMYWMAIKALQEAQARIESLEADVAQLKGD